MNKTIWIMNHYATNTFIDKAGRHYWFAENLKKSNYEPTIFCASTIHNSNECIDTYGEKYVVDFINNIPFVFVKTPKYEGNGKKRIFNMITFYINIFSVARSYAKINGIPDVILASSVHPLTLVAGIKIAREFGVPCICEVRDLWPESIVEYGSLQRNSILAKTLYFGEKWIYKNADKLIFTMEGGKDYVIERGWDRESGGPIDLNKVYHINNGVDIDAFNFNKEHFKLEDEDLNNPNIFKVVYTGSIRLVNKVEMLVDVAKELKDKDKDIRFLIWGDGDQANIIRQRIQDEKINNVVLKGRVDKKYIPYITTKSDLNVILGENKPLYKYGISFNKLFEYLAAGKPILSTLKTGYSIIDRYNVGIEVENNNTDRLCKEILRMKNIDREKYEEYCKNALMASKDYTFKALTDKLTNIIEELLI